MDFAFSKIILISLVGLAVIGPKDLPRVARMVGRALGRAITMRERLWAQLREQSEPLWEAGRLAGEEGRAIHVSLASSGLADEPWGRPLPEASQLDVQSARNTRHLTSTGLSRIERKARASRAERLRWRGKVGRRGRSFTPP